MPEKFHYYWDHSLVFQDSIEFLEELNYVLMSKMPRPLLQMDSWTKFLEAYIFLSFLRKFTLSFGLIISCMYLIMQR